MSSRKVFKMSRVHNLTGKRFGKLTVVKEASKSLSKQIRWECVCDCGKTSKVDTMNLVTGHTRSCGCLRSAQIGERTWKGHGEISANRWGHIVQGANKRKILISIGIEDGWRLFQAQNGLCAFTGQKISFRSRFGETKSIATASLDRINNDLGYHIDNVQWVHKDINMMRRDLSPQRFIDLCCLVAAHTKSIAC